MTDFKKILSGVVCPLISSMEYFDWYFYGYLFKAIFYTLSVTCVNVRDFINACELALS